MSKSQSDILKAPLSGLKWRPSIRNIVDSSACGCRIEAIVRHLRLSLPRTRLLLLALLPRGTHTSADGGANWIYSYQLPNNFTSVRLVYGS